MWFSMRLAALGLLASYNSIRVRRGDSEEHCSWVFLDIPPMPSQAV